MNKQEFATRLLFWLMPWPISKSLPLSLRIQYFGPSGYPPSGYIPPWSTGPLNIFDPYRIGPSGPGISGPYGDSDLQWIDITDPLFWEDPLDGIEWEPAYSRWKYRCSYEAAHSLIPSIGVGWADFARPLHIKVSHFGDCGEINLFLSTDVAQENNYLSGQILSCDYSAGQIAELELVSTDLSVPWANFGYITNISVTPEEEE